MLSVAAELIALMRPSRAVALQELRDRVEDELGPAALVNFLPALSLLYLAGNLEYDDETDSVFWLERSRAVAA